MAQDLDTDDLLKFAAAGAAKARDELLERHRESDGCDAHGPETQSAF